MYPFQAVFKQFGGGGYGGSDNMVTDEAELMLHQKLERLYISTRAAKHFQRDIVRGVEGYIVTGSKQVEIGKFVILSSSGSRCARFGSVRLLALTETVNEFIGTKLSEDSRKYGIENTCTSGNTLSRAAVNFSRARVQMEKERGNLLKSFGTQVAEPLRAMVMGAPLEDARHLAQRYDRMRQEAEAQVIEVSKRQAKVIDGSGNPELFSRLEAAEAKLQDLKSNMAVLERKLHRQWLQLKLNSKT
ncbi:putative AH/BAR domain superfamily protein [Helianthus annuus]|nr:putative AH/BAR domain superfamily protein [Helianthus annuus]